MNFSSQCVTVFNKTLFQKFQNRLRIEQLGIKTLPNNCEENKNKIKLIIMNSLKQFFLQANSNSFKNLYKAKATCQSVIVNRSAVRTPFCFSDRSSNMLQSKWFSRNFSNKLPNMQNLFRRVSPIETQRNIHDIPAVPKKRPGLRKKRSDFQEKMAQNGYLNVIAYATAEEYDLERLLTALKAQDLYEPKKFFSSDNNENEPDVLYAAAKYQVEDEPRGIYFFREGTVVMWNFSDMESSNVLGFLKDFEQVRITYE